MSNWNVGSLCASGSWELASWELACLGGAVCGLPSSASSESLPLRASSRNAPREAERSRRRRVAASSKASSRDGKASWRAPTSSCEDQPTCNEARRSDSAGRFVFRALPAGVYEVRASFEGVVPVVQHVAVGERRASPLQLVLGIPLAEAKELAALKLLQAAVASGAPRGLAEERRCAASPAASCAAPGEFNTAAYDRITDNAFRRVTDEPLSTFSIDVDTASYTQRPPLPARRASCRRADAVRVEELVNYFRYDYRQPARRRADRDQRPRSALVPVEHRPQARAHRPRRRSASTDAAAAAQPRLPRRRVGSMQPPRPAAARQDGAAACSSTRCGRATASPSSPTPAAAGWCCRRRPGDQKHDDPSRHRTSCHAGGSTNGGPGISSPTSVARQSVRPGRRQPRHPRHRRRLQRRRHQPGRAGAPHRGAAQDRRLPVGPRLRHGQPQGLDDGEAGRPRQRPLRVYRLAARSAARARRRGERDARAVAKDVKVQVEFNPQRRGGVPSDRLREPAAEATRTSTTTRRTPARWAPATPSRRSTRSCRTASPCRGRRRPAEVSGRAGPHESARRRAS